MEHSEMLEKAGLTAFFVAVTAAIGWLGWLVLLFAVSMGTDYLSGTILAMRRGVWSSAEARAGLLHKACEIGIAFAALIVDGLLYGVAQYTTIFQASFNYTALLFPLVLVWYILTELGSIIENIGQLGVPVPGFLTRMVKVLKSATEGAGERYAPEDEGK